MTPASINVGVPGGGGGGGHAERYATPLKCCKRKSEGTIIVLLIKANMVKDPRTPVYILL